MGTNVSDAKASIRVVLSESSVLLCLGHPALNACNLGDSAFPQVCDAGSILASKSFGISVCTFQKRMDK